MMVKAALGGEGREARGRPRCWWWRRQLLRQQEDRRGTDDDVRLRMRHTAARIVWKLVVGTADLLLLFLLCMGLACGS